MVLGLRSKHKKDTSVQIDYLVHVKEIKPWPPSQSLKSVESVLLQWENGNQNVGSLASGVGDGTIEFNESFTVPVTLCREKRARDNFQKNCLEFYLFEPHKDKPAKDKLLGTSLINLADYGVIRENVTISALVNCKKSSRNTPQPVLFVNIQPFDKESYSSSPKSSLSKEASLDKNGGESISGFGNEGNDDEYEIASFTDDDDISSHSSRTISSSAFETTRGSPTQNVESGQESEKNKVEGESGEHALPLGVEPAKSVEKVVESSKQTNRSSEPLSSTVLSSDLGNSVNSHAELSKFPERNLIPIKKNLATHFVQSPSLSFTYQDTNEASGNCIKSFKHEDMTHDFHDGVSDGKFIPRENVQQSVYNVDKHAAEVRSLDTRIQVGANSNSASFRYTAANEEYCGQASRGSRDAHLDATTINEVHVGPLVGQKKKDQQENGQEQIIDAIRKQGIMSNDSLISSRIDPGRRGTRIANNKLKHVKSVQLPFESVKADKILGNNLNFEKAKKTDISDHVLNYARGNDAASHKPKTEFVESEVAWKSKIEMLEEELREAAALEAALYSIVAEHGSSTNKVHAPARRLSRFYLHACKARSQAKRESAARAAISGLVLVSKACGNDVPRLAFWLSNSIMLRAIIKQAFGEMLLSDESNIESDGHGKGFVGRSSLKWNESSSNEIDKKHSAEEFEDQKDLQAFIIELEKVEAWIFSRIVESVWWQTLTPHMQSTAAKTSGGAMNSSSKKTYKSRSVLGDQDQGKFSIELWNKAFKDACERLCPIRAGGHECGCLPVLARLVMEQLVGRLDVAMFNAILRESDDEMPTDPVSDPFSESKVLPMPAGKSSFGAGAQLKNAVGNWSRWLTDLFGIEDNESTRNTDSLDYDNDNKLGRGAPFKAFRLLNALSDLMMLPSEMLGDSSARNEVCPIFGPPLIKRVLNNFVPDAFCPDPIPSSVFEALDAEDDLEAEGECVTSFPCIAAPIVYSPPPAALLAALVGEVGSQSLRRSGSSVLRKSYTSDDELDELDSPISSIVHDNHRLSPTMTKAVCMRKENGGRKVVRYQLLREVWRDVK